MSDTPQPDQTPVYDAEIKARLEYAIAGRDVIVRHKGKSLTFRKWGLRQNLTMGSKVLSLIARVQETFSTEELLKDPAVFMGVLSKVADDVVDIVSASMVSTFKSQKEAQDWMDDNIESVDELFDLAYIVYDQNLKGGGLGKLTGGMESLSRKVASLSTSSSKS